MDVSSTQPVVYLVRTKSLDRLALLLGYHLHIYHQFGEQTCPSYN